VVVAKDGEVLARAHRGEGGTEHHAEHVALDRHVKDDEVSGATV
jgi:pyrimidine deaminase RibD-like protein